MFACKPSSLAVHRVASTVLPLVSLTLAAMLLVGASPSAEANPLPLFDGDPCLGRSPVNASVEPQFQFIYTGVMYDDTGQPAVGVPAEQFILRINTPCANPIELHPDGPSDQDGRLTWGAVTLTQGGGACHGPEAMQIVHDVFGVIWGLDDVRSPDLDGDGYVALGDLVEWQLAFVNQTPLCQGDLDCDRTHISVADLLVWQRHFVAAR